MPAKSEPIACLSNPLAVSEMPRMLEELSEEVRRSSVTLGAVKGDTTSLQPLLALLDLDEAESLGQSLQQALKAINARLETIEQQLSETATSLEALNDRQMQTHETMARLAGFFESEDPPSF